MKEWSSLIILSCAACTLIEFLIPKGSVGKVMNMILGAFMICAVITPLTFKGSSLALKAPNFETKKAVPPKNFLEKATNRAESMVEKSVKSIISGVLADKKIKHQKIEVFTDKNEKPGISIIKCKVFVQKEDITSKEDIKNEIENKLRIETEVLDGTVK